MANDRHIVTIDGRKFVIVKATAEDQSKIHRAFKRYGITMDVLKTAVLTEGLTPFAALIEFSRNAPDDVLDFVEEKMLFIVETETGDKVSIHDFHCNHSLRERLFMEALQVNFGDFFDYVGLIGSSHLEKLTQTQKETT